MNKKTIYDISSGSLLDYGNRIGVLDIYSNYLKYESKKINFIDDKNIIRPANYSKNNPGRGYDIYECKGKKIAVMNFIGRGCHNERICRF